MNEIRDFDGQEVGSSTSAWKASMAGFVGSIIEWFDYYLYGTASALVLGTLFFPEFSSVAGTLAAFATFGVGFVTRPIGAIIAGHLGDTLGRKTTLVLTLLIMGIATVLIGCLPGYSSIGFWAPLLLVLLRLLQGFGVGGEWGGAAVYVTEFAPRRHRGFFASLIQTGNGAGLLLATGLFALLTAVTTKEQFLAWGWRIPFFCSVILIGVGLYIRLRLTESPAFTKAKKVNRPTRSPVIDVIRNNPKNVLLAVGIAACVMAFSYIIISFTVSYATKRVGLSSDTVLVGTTLAAAVSVIAMPSFGALSDRVGRRPVFIGGATLSVLFAFPFFWLINTGTSSLVWIAFIIGQGIAVGSMNGVMPAFFSELFSVRMRYSGASLGYQLSGTFLGGFAPFIAAALVAATGGDTWSVSIYIVVIALITVVCTYLATETFRHELSDDEGEVNGVGEEVGVPSSIQAKES